MIHLLVIVHLTAIRQFFLVTLRHVPSRWIIPAIRRNTSRMIGHSVDACHVSICPMERARTAHDLTANGDTLEPAVVHNICCWLPS